jgi:hypothetical protein
VSWALVLIISQQLKWSFLYSTFVLTYPPDEIPEAIIGFARLLIEQEAWEKARDKGKVPKPKIERTSGGINVIQVLLRCIEIRREAYTCSLKVSRSWVMDD